MPFSDYRVLDICTPELKPAFSNILFWRRYFHRDEIQKNEITKITGEEEILLSDEEYFALENQKEQDYEVKSDYALFKNVLVKFELFPEYALLLDIDFPALYILSDHTEISQIATNDEAHFMPDLFRREELENICKCLARKYDFLIHPGIPLLLLWYYCPVTKDADSNDFLQSLNTAWKNIGIIEDEFSSDFFDLFDSLASNHSDANWYFDNDFGFFLDDDKEMLYSNVYSLRTKRNKNFPSIAFNDLMDKVENFIRT